MTVRPRQTQHQPHPRETSDRCALRAQLRGDPMLGTAFPAARLLLLWGRREPSARVDVLGNGAERPIIDALLGW